MDSLLQPLLTFVLLYKYYAIFLLTFVGAVAAPIPSGSILIASAFFVTQGYLDFMPLFISGLLGNVIGDNLGFFLAQKYGQTFFKKIGLRKMIESTVYKNLELKIAEFPITTVFTSRFMSVITPAVNVVAGMAKMPFWTFFWIEVAGVFVEVLFMTGCGYIFGDNWQYVEHILGTVGSIVSLVVVLALFVLWKQLSKRRLR